MTAKVSRFALLANSPPLSEVRSSKAQLFHSKLTIYTHDGQKQLIGGLNKGEAEVLRQLIQTSAEKHRKVAEQRAEE